MVKGIREIAVPRLSQVIDRLKDESKDQNLFGGVSIGSAAKVVLRCGPLGWDLLVMDEEELRDYYRDCDSIEVWDEVYLGDCLADLRAIGHRLISGVRDREEKLLSLGLTTG